METDRGTENGFNLISHVLYFQALAERGDTLTSVEKNSSTLVEHTATMRNSMQKLKEKRAAQAGKLL